MRDSIQPAAPVSNKTPYEPQPAPIYHYELAILCLDASLSMRGLIRPLNKGDASPPSKSEEMITHLISAKDGFLQRLQNGKNSRGFFLGLVAFDDRVTMVQPRPILELSVNDLEIGQLRRYGERTAIGAALERAKVMAEAWLAAPKPTSNLPCVVTIILLSDGQETAGSDPLIVAERIKADAENVDALDRYRITIATAAYGADADEGVLRTIATLDAYGEPMFARVESGEQLREFCIASIATRQ